MANKKLKNNVSKYRVYKNITQKQLCKDLGISKAWLRHIEKQEYSPNYILAQKICEYFDVSFDQMFEVRI